MHSKFTRFTFLAFLTLGFLISGINKSYATHAMGADLSYTRVGTTGQTYKIVLTVYRDCAGVSAPGSASIGIKSATESVSTSVSVTRDSAAYEVSLLCPSVSSRCSGGSWPGTQVVTFTKTVDLTSYTTSGKATDWTFFYSLCCRNNAIDNITTPGSRSLYIEATLNNSTFTGNNSTLFTNLPIPYLCKDQKANYNHGTYEPDGDSLKFEIIQSLNNATTSIPYSAGLDTDTPLYISDTFLLDPKTGQFTFTPDVAQNSVVCMRVTEYRSGLKIGTVMREVQMVVQSCTNSNPTLVHPVPLEACPGDTVRFTVVGSDIDYSDTLSLKSNAGTVTVGATFSSTGTNPIYGYYTWVPGVSDTGKYIISFTVRDNACPIPGTNTYAVELNVINGTRAQPDTGYYCPGDPGVQLRVDGGKKFKWTVLSGSPITSATFSCDTCRDPVATPSMTTTYLVTSDLSSSCGNTDTVVVKNDYVFDAGKDTIICPGDSFTLGATASGDLVKLGELCGFPPDLVCGGTDSAHTIGTATGASGTNTPLAGLNTDSRFQMLFRASELSALGSGILTQIDMNVGGKLSYLPYKDFTIKIGCTEKSYLTIAGGFEEGLDVVYGPISYSSKSGVWNTFPLDQNWVWDGKSNIIVEICFNNTSTSIYDNVRTTTTPFASCLQQKANSGNGCTFKSPGWVGTSRPHMRFTVCPFPPKKFHYEWTPGVTLSDSTIATPTSIPASPTWYYVKITGGYCPGFDSVYIDLDVCLPIELLRFDVMKQENDALLKWITLTESNSHYFDIEHSVDGMNFFPIGKVDAAGNSADELNYQFLHEDPAKGINYYRLKMVDLDGSYEYSEVRAVRFDGNNGEIKVYPNPINEGNTFFVDLSQVITNDESIDLVLYNAIGEIAMMETVDTKDLKQPIELKATAQLAAAIYTLSVNTTEAVYQVKLSIN